MGLFSRIFGDDEAGRKQQELLGDIGESTRMYLQGDQGGEPMDATALRQDLLEQARKPLEPDLETLAEDLVRMLQNKLDISELSDEERTCVVMIGVQVYDEHGREGMMLLENRVMTLMGPVWIVQDAWRHMRDASQ